MLELLANREFFEDFDLYQPNEGDYLDVVKKLLPDSWTFHRNGTWFSAAAPDRDNNPLPMQGWKIHVSSSVNNAKEILKAVVSVLAEDNTNFKFSLDKNILSMMNGKAYGRQAAGKFITVYPFNDEHFKVLAEKLHQVTKNFQGLYILSDRRYKDSKVIFYRYGGILPISTVTKLGKRSSRILSPEGKEVDDLRVPYFRVPEWTRDPFEDSSEIEELDPAEVTLKDGRYLVKFPLGFSNSGGVYVAEDRQTGEEVVIKEARPFISTTDNSLELLEKEYRILTKLSDTGFVPKPIDFFQDWEHSFLVMERAKGGALSSISSSRNITLKTRPTLEDTQKFYENFTKIFIQLARNLKTMHERGIVFTDFSPNNIVVDPETMNLKMIDFEGAYEIGVDPPVQLFTPGFVAPSQAMGEKATFESDCFALGATMHHFLAPINQVFVINSKIRYTYIKSVIDDIGFPESIYQLIISLIEKEPENRPAPKKIIKALEKKVVLREPKFQVDKEAITKECFGITKPICDYILAKADFSRNDRLFPADKEIFSTNPLSLAHGAVGVAYCIKKMREHLPESVIDWILARNKTPELYPTGLYIGLSGIAWGMLDLGLVPESREVMQSTFNHPLLYESADLYHGISGWGLANLKFFFELQDEMFLQKAVEAGEFIVKNLSENEKGCFWDTEGGIHLGYHFGSSGISLFLLYLYLASKKDIFLEVGKKTIDFDINNASSNIENGISWRKIVDRGRIVYPYLGEGSAGVGKAIVRYYRLLGDEKYRTMLDKIFDDTNRKYTVFPGMNNGISGIGDFLLDLYELTKNEDHLDGAYRVAAGTLLSKIEKEEGVAYPGSGLVRISCDYGTGSAGIGRFFHRLVNHGESADFLIDQYFEKSFSANISI